MDQIYVDRIDVIVEYHIKNLNLGLMAALRMIKMSLFWHDWINNLIYKSIKMISYKKAQQGTIIHCGTMRNPLYV